MSSDSTHSARRPPAPANGEPARSALVSVVFSFRNEQEVLDELIRRTVAVMEREPERYELIFVDDDSTDASLDVLHRARLANSRIKILRMSRKFGVSECVQAGMAHASGDAIVYLDADLQDPPEVIPQLLEKWREGADVVHTVRSKRLGESWLKMALTRMGYRLISMGSIVKLITNAGDFKLLSRRAVERLLEIKETDPYLRGLVVWVGYRQEQVHYERAPRAAGSTHFPFFSKNPWKTFVSGLTSFSFVPIYAVMAAGLAGLGIAGLALLVGLLASLKGAGVGAVGWLAVLLLFCWATLMLAVGTVGVYVMRIYKDVRARPPYIVRDSIGFGPPEHQDAHAK